MRARSGPRRILLYAGAATVAFGLVLTALTGSPLALLAVAFGAADVATGVGMRWGRKRAGAPTAGDGGDPRRAAEEEIASSNGHPYAGE